MVRDIVVRDSGITHNSRSRSRLDIHARTFDTMRKGMVAAELVAKFVRDKIDVEIVAHRDAVGWRGDTAALLSVDTNTADTARISATARSTEHVSDIIIGFSDIGRKRVLQLAVPLSHRGIR